MKAQYKATHVKASKGCCWFIFSLKLFNLNLIFWIILIFNKFKNH